MKKVLVITPSVGSDKLIDAVCSVHAQTYPVDHLIVLDGPNAFLPIDVIRYRSYLSSVLIEPLKLPFNTGANGYYGHRIYAGMSKMIDTEYDYILLLDEDNWYLPTHVEDMVKTLQGQEFAYSLRGIYDKNKNFLLNDDGESLGYWPIAGNDENGYLVDTSSYGFTNKTFREIGYLWDNGWGADRIFYGINRITRIHKCTGAYTLAYRLDGNPNSPTKEFFEQVNIASIAAFPDKPWTKK